MLRTHFRGIIIKKTDNEILILSGNSGKIKKLSNSGSISKIGLTHFASVLDVKGERKKIQR